jgi:N-dimethylarginine dimethylaminohydrolase
MEYRNGEVPARAHPREFGAAAQAVSTKDFGDFHGVRIYCPANPNHEDDAMTPNTLSEVGPIRRIVLRHPRDAFVDEARIDAQWHRLNYLGRPDLGRALEEYERLVELIAMDGTEVHYLPAGDGLTLDSVYVRDAIIPSAGGAILCNMGKPERRGEPATAAAHFAETGIQVAGAITGDGFIEGGDVTWLDDATIVAGQGYRTNAEGIRQLGEILGPSVDIVVAPLPHWQGPDDVFHLMSMLSPIDHDLALVYSPLLPVPFRQTLLERGMAFVEVPDEEFASMGCNVLALAPRRAVMLSGNPVTRDRLEAAGVEVHVIEGDEISQKGCGGPTCLTRPMERG